MSKKSREVPNIEMPEIEGYATPIASGWDTVKETFKVSIPERLLEQLEITKREGRDNGRAGSMVRFGREDFRLWPTGASGSLFVLENDDYRVYIKPPQFEWCVSIEYTAAGLWEYGLHALRERALENLLLEVKPLCDERDLGRPVAWQRVSVAHFAFDFHSPEFSKDMTSRIYDTVICPAPVGKGMNKQEPGYEENSQPVEAWGRGRRIETLTIGKKSTLQLQIYDKGREITAASGKTWMYKIWAQAGYKPEIENGKERARDVWRVEIRFGSKFLKDRGVLTLPELHEKLHALLTEAIFTRRITVESVTDRNRWRWPLHPLFVCVYKQTDGLVDYPPLGRQKTESDEVMAERIKKAIAGNLRALTVLAVGDMDSSDAWRFVQEAYDLMIKDPDGEKKNEKARTRYFYAGEAA